MPTDTLSLGGKVAVITGSGKDNGIGASITEALARNGARVVINYVLDSTAPRAAEVVKKIKDQEGNVVAIQSDVSSSEGASNLVSQTLDAFSVDQIEILGEWSYPS